MLGVAFEVGAPAGQRYNPNARRYLAKLANEPEAVLRGWQAEIQDHAIGLEFAKLVSGSRGVESRGYTMSISLQKHFANLEPAGIVVYQQDARHQLNSA